jgi:hypothetical protein
MVRGLVIAVCGILLGIGGCLGFIATMDGAGPENLGVVLAVLGGGAFLTGLIGLASGAIIFVIGMFKWLFKAIAPEQPK